MEPSLAVQSAMATGSIAAIFLFFLRRRMPRWIGLALAVAAITGVFVTVTLASNFGLMMLFMGVFHAVGLNGDGAGWMGLGLANLILPLRAPFRFVLGSGSGDLAFTLDSAWWALIQIFAAATVIACVDRVPLTRGLDRLRSSLERSWPDGRRAALSSIIAALVLFGMPILLRRLLPFAPVSGPGIAAIVLLRFYRPKFVSWGAWMLAMLALPSFILKLIPASVLSLTIGGWNYVALAALAAILALAGPRREPRVTRWHWLLYTILFVLPGLGWMARHFMFAE